MAEQVARITVRHRGAVPRNIRKIHTQASKEAWYSTGRRFHAEHRDDRFTHKHARKAKYKKRDGEEPGITRKEFFRSYTGRKKRKFGHTRPLEWSGETRRAVRSANITATSKGGRVKYAGARKLNFRNPHSDIHMADEFRRLIPEEIEDLADHYDDVLDRELNADTTTTTEVI